MKRFFLAAVTLFGFGAMLSLNSSIAVANIDAAFSVPAGMGTTLDFAEDETNYIDSSDMKRADKIKKAEEKAVQNEKRRVKVDSEAMMRQRALDYTTRRTNSMLNPGGPMGF